MYSRILILLGLLGGCHPGGPPPPRAHADLALVGATIRPSPSEPPIEHGIVLVEHGKIMAVGRAEQIGAFDAAKVVDCAGLTLTPGFWNSHVHFVRLNWGGADAMPAAQLAAQLREMLGKYGFTTVVDTGSPQANTAAIQRRVDSGEVRGPRILAVGPVLAASGMFPPPAVMHEIGYLPDATIEVRTPDEARERVRAVIEHGAVGVKMYAATSAQSIVEMSPAVVDAITAEAHRAGKLALVHPYNAHGLQAAVDASVDILVHTIPNAGELSAASITAMKRKGIALIPTLKLWAAEAEREHMPAEAGAQFLARGVEQLSAYARAGGTILFGTDVGYMPDHDPTDEYVLMQRAGLDVAHILASLTTAPVERFGLAGTTGRIAADMDADIVLLAGDPASDIRAFANVRATLRAGKVLFATGIGGPDWIVP